MTANGLPLMAEQGGSGTMAVMAEHSFRPSYTSPPGETIADLLEEREMTQTELAERLGVTLKHVNQVVNHGASISADLALGLEKVFRVPAHFWLNRESLYQADLARQNEEKQLESKDTEFANILYKLRWSAERGEWSAHLTPAECKRLLLQVDPPPTWWTVSRGINGKTTWSV